MTSADGKKWSEPWGAYFQPLCFPDVVTAGIRVSKLGNSIVRYEVGLFRNEEKTVAAAGHFVHVYVNRATGRPVPLPEPLRVALTPLLVSPT